MTTAIREDLRGVIKRTRENPVLWNKPRGLSQRELSEKTGTSELTIRSIETGRKKSATPATLGNICFALGIDSEWLKLQGYGDVAQVVADCVEADILLSGTDTGDGDRSAEQHLRDTPGLTEDEADRLVEIFHQLRRRRTELLGRDIWRRKRA